jgi:hypothetical protein
MNFENINIEYHVRNKLPIALVISSYQVNRNASRLLRVALDSMLFFKNKESCIWVIDVGSPKTDFLVTPDEYPTVNFVITSYTPRSWEGDSFKKSFVKKFFGIKPPRSGSHANGWTLNLGIHAFQENNYMPLYFMTLHMDIMFTRDNALDVLLSMFDDNTAAAGFRKQLNYDKTRDILHSLGCLWSMKNYIKLEGSFMNEFPAYDVGERLVADAVDKGMHIKNLSNTFSQPELNHTIKEKELQNWKVDKALDFHGNVVFVHLGRGVLKSEGGEIKKVSIDDWQELWNDIRRKHLQGKI